MPMQKQACLGQRTQFKVFVAIGDHNGHAGLGVKFPKAGATATRAAIMLAKLSIVSVQRGCWGNKVRKLHTVPFQLLRWLRAGAPHPHPAGHWYGYKEI